MQRKYSHPTEEVIQTFVDFCTHLESTETVQNNQSLHQVAIVMTKKHGLNVSTTKTEVTRWTNTEKCMAQTCHTTHIIAVCVLTRSAGINPTTHISTWTNTPIADYLNVFLGLHLTCRCGTLF